MKLEQFREKNKRKKIVITLSVFVVLLLTGLFLYKSFAFFESQKNYDVIKGIVSYNPSDIIVTSYLDGTISKIFPNKDDKYAVEKVVCSNGAYGTWNYSNWEVNIQNLTNTKTKCKVYFITRYKENNLNGTDPIISESLIPVTIANDGTVKKADMKSEWYNYSNKQWANAVILEDETTQYNNGEVIPESNIESYFVWIPRYKYKIFNEGNYNSATALSNISSYQNKAQEIEIVFENKNTTVSNGNIVGTYLTHPAFTSFDTNGMWVGKFETGYKDATNKQSAEQNLVNVSKIQIKPNVYSWRGVQVSNAHLNSFNYKRELDSHMMKNTEWGAVAYLSHSKYGILSTIRINNNSDNLTGFAANSEPQEPSWVYTGFGTTNDITSSWNSTGGIVASTTGNISGIYDMSGGTQEYVMGVLASSDGIPYSGVSSSVNSGFNGPLSNETFPYTSGVDFPNNKYFDLYQNNLNTSTSYLIRKLGDATGELGPFYTIDTRGLSSWYQDNAFSLWSGNMFYTRGGNFSQGTVAGIFNFDLQRGQGDTYRAYRIVLMP